MLKQFFKKLDEKCTIQKLVKVIAVLLILYLLLATQAYWGSWVAIVLSIIKPFLIGLVIAYVMYPMVRFLQQKGLSKNVSIVLLWGVAIAFLAILLIVLMPLLYDKISGFIASMTEGVLWISDKIKEIGQFENFSLIDSLTKNIINMISAYEGWLPQFVATLPNIMSVLVDSVTTIGFSIIIAIYMLADFKTIRHNIKSTFVALFPSSEKYLYEIDENVTVYLKSMIVIMLIKLFEYWAFYYLIGHPDWVIIGILSSLGSLIPYLGGTIANSIGIITALTLSPLRILLLLLGIFVLSHMDAYVISPLVHEKRSAVGPLVTLFVIFAGGVIMGWVGIMLAMLVAIIIKTIIEVKKEENNNKGSV